MGEIIFLTGGARSGKSSYALKLVKNNGGRVAFIATCKPADAEMKRRVLRHKNIRPKHWVTFEETQKLPVLLKRIYAKFDNIIIDCLTLLVSGFLLAGLKESAIKAEIRKILSAIKESRAQCVIVSNEVGLGIVPENKLARDFRDIAGSINQIVAKEAVQVFFLVSGIPWRIK